MNRLAALVVSVAGLAHPAAADIINVPGNAVTIQAAINAAQNGDEIIVAPGNYAESIDFTNPNSFALRSSGGPSVTTIQRAELFGLVGPQHWTIDGFTVLDGIRMQAGADPATFLNCVLQGGNSTGKGAGLQARGTSTVINCTFIDNFATQEGGGLWVNGNATILNCSFVGNSANTIGGGGMFVGGGSPIIIGCTFVNNTASNLGGGVLLDGRGSGTFINCIFVGNTADYGGAVHNASSSTFTNCLFFGNSAGLAGGAIFNATKGFNQKERASQLVAGPG